MRRAGFLVLCLGLVGLLLVAGCAKCGMCGKKPAIRAACAACGGKACDFAQANVDGQKVLKCTGCGAIVKPGEKLKAACPKCKYTMNLTVKETDGVVAPYCDHCKVSAKPSCPCQAKAKCTKCGKVGCTKCG